MGKGSLQRIAALTALATGSVMVAGPVNVGALVGISTPEISTTLPATGTQVTVPSTTTTVPSTSVTPQPTVTTPKVSTPKVTVPSTKTTVPSTPVTPKTTVTTPEVSTPKVKTPSTQVTAPSISGGGGSSDGGGGGGSGDGATIRDRTSSTLGTVGGVVEGTRSGALAGGGGAAGGTLAGGGTAGGGSPAAGALAVLDSFGGGPGSTGGSAGSGGGGLAGISGRPGGGGGLPPTLSPARARQLREALEQLAGCMSAIAPLDRRVLSMRAGMTGAAPLSRSQVAARLGLSARQVRFSERRGLSGLRVAAEQSGCAGAIGGSPFAVSGIGAMTLATLLAPPGTDPAVLAQSGGRDYVPARQAGPGVGPESPLARLAGGGESGPAWLVVLFTVLFSVSVAALMRELRSSVGA